MFTKFSIVLAQVLAAGMLFAGCGGSGSYTVQYTDDEGVHTFKVQNGGLYSLETVPSRYGYEFLGLFDAETGGTQYVGANGSAVAPYPDTANKVLYPQFKPIDYTVILDYGEAPVTSVRSLTVAYDSALPELPKNVTLEHNVFNGWYTAENCGGTQVSDMYGNLPAILLNNKTFTFDDENRRTYLYAGFELETYAVTLHFGGSIPDETVQVPYGTPVKDVIFTTRNSDKMGVLLWSTEPNDEAKEHLFNGKITGEIELYAAEWAPVIELDGNGVDLPPIIARAGTPITLPTPEKPLSKFVRWETETGQEAVLTVMPAASISLKAVWQAKLEFDENGGTEVSDLAASYGSSITLPKTEKEGFLFAGWYTADGEKFTETTMPSEGVALKAGWYREQQKQVVLLSADEESYSISWTYNIFEHGTNKAVGPDATKRISLDLSDVLPADGGEIELSLHWTSYLYCKDTISQAGFHFYDDPIVSEANHVGEIVVSEITSVKKQCTFEGTLTLRSNTLYLCYYGKSGSHEPDGYAYDRLYFADIYAEIGYPDTSELFL